MIAAKVKCSAKSESGEGDERRVGLAFYADYADGRNKEWAIATPTLSLTMTVRGDVAERFEQGKAYTLTFEESDVPVSAASERHPATAAILRYFAWQHLPPHLQAVSRPFGEMAERIADTLPPGPEVTAGLRKLLEAKDCAVRAALDKTPV